jgi:hypothetical protein
VPASASATALPIPRLLPVTKAARRRIIASSASKQNSIISLSRNPHTQPISLAALMRFYPMRRTAIPLWWLLKHALEAPEP